MSKSRINPLLSIPTNDIFQIPIHFSNEEKASYLQQLKQRFLEIGNLLNSLHSEYFEPIIKNEICERISNFQNGLIKVVREYLNGYPSGAYELFQKTLIGLNIVEELNSQMQIQIPRNSVFFRTQKHYSAIPERLKGGKGRLNYKLPFNLFHPPFQSRHTISTNRFSISGYPCLYISQKLETSYSECFPEDDKITPFHVMALKNIRPLYFIDLSETYLLGNKMLFEEILPKKKKGFASDVSRLLNNLVIYQLIIASHTKVGYKESYKGERFYFKFEYIIPQLFLQWLKQHGYAVDGIRYCSCTGIKKFTSIKDHYNYVLPVRHSLDKGYCPTLSSLFSFSEVYSYFAEDEFLNIVSVLKGISGELNDATFESLIK